MKHIFKHSSLLLLAVTVLLLAGCIVSGTFVVTLLIDRDEFTTGDNFYYYGVDLTDEDVWQDHKDDIESIDVVGFELWITNNSGSATTFNIWIEDIGQPQRTTIAQVQANATQVVQDLSVPTGSSHVTYGQSLSHVINIPTLRALAMSGAFHYYGSSSVGGPGAQYVVDSARVIVTLTASN